jgi:DNA-binding CsgD family transcriptional regulator
MTLTALARDDEAFEATAVVSDLVGFASLVLPLVQLHIRLTETDTSPAACASGMEQRLAGMFPELTSRERQVCARSIIGMTAEGIALDLGIKQTSVLTYRRRAYARLNICSINQLSSMLIQSGTPLASAA